MGKKYPFYFFLFVSFLAPSTESLWAQESPTPSRLGKIIQKIKTPFERRKLRGALKDHLETNRVDLETFQKQLKEIDQKTDEGRFIALTKKLEIDSRHQHIALAERLLKEKGSTVDDLQAGRKKIGKAYWEKMDAAAADYKTEKQRKKDLLRAQVKIGTHRMKGPRE